MATPTDNQTIIAVPVGLEAPGQTRQFLVHLVEKLDIAFGYRGGDSYISQGDLLTATGEASGNLTELERRLLAYIDNAVSIVGAATQEYVDQEIDKLKSPQAIANANITTETVSDPPTQAEVQAIADRVTENATTFNNLLVALRDTEIIET